jgi:hypothetical protein
VSGSESIRQFIAKNRQAGPKDIQAGLAAEGITVKFSLINAVKYSNRKTAGKKRRASSPVVQAAARKTPSVAAAVTFKHLVEVKKLADSMGGADQIRAVLDSLAQLQ